MNLIDCFRPSLEERPNEAALELDGVQRTFGELKRSADRVAGALRESFGVRRGDRVVLYLPNCVEGIACYLACLRLGAIVVPLNPSLRGRELARFMRSAEPRLLVTDRERLSGLDPELTSTGFGCGTQIVAVGDEIGARAQPLGRVGATAARRLCSIGGGVSPPPRQRTRRS